jgi:hypothetical protein
MNSQRLKLVCIALFVSTTVGAAAQSPHDRNSRSAQGSLTVSVVVESSVGLMPGSDGQHRLVVANAPDPKETFSPRESLNKNSRSPVSYSFPRRPADFDRTRETQLMDVRGGNNRRQQVTLITVVPR